MKKRRYETPFIEAINVALTETIVTSPQGDGSFRVNPGTVNGYEDELF